MTMTKPEQRKMRKLELDNEMYQAAFNRHMDVYREISLENINLRARIQHIEEVLLELGKDIQGGTVMEEFYNCPRCGITAEPKTIIMESGHHYAKEVCSVCGRYIKWLKKPFEREGWVKITPCEEF